MDAACAAHEFTSLRPVSVLFSGTTISSSISLLQCLPVIVFSRPQVIRVESTTPSVFLYGWSTTIYVLFQASLLPSSACSSSGKYLRVILLSKIVLINLNCSSAFSAVAEAYIMVVEGSRTISQAA